MTQAGWSVLGGGILSLGFMVNSGLLAHQAPPGAVPAKMRAGVASQAAPAKPATSPAPTVRPAAAPAAPLDDNAVVHRYCVDLSQRHEKNRRPVACRRSTWRRCGEHAEDRRKNDPQAAGGA